MKSIISFVLILFVTTFFSVAGVAQTPDKAGKSASCCQAGAECCKSGSCCKAEGCSVKDHKEQNSSMAQEHNHGQTGETASCCAAGASCCDGGACCAKHKPARMAKGKSTSCCKPGAECCKGGSCCAKQAKK